MSARRLDLSRLAQPRLQVQSLPPRFGENYKAGYIGFLDTSADTASKGIAYFTRWSRLSDVHVSQPVVVTGENTCVEVLAGKGVVRTPLEKYFNDPKVRIFFRKPRKCSSSLGERIAAAADTQVGVRSEQLILAARVLENSFLQRWIRSAFAQNSDRFLSKLLNQDIRWLGGELAAYSLDAQPEYAGKGLLDRPQFSVDPQTLFEDEELFAAWKSQPVEEDEVPPAL